MNQTENGSDTYMFNTKKDPKKYINLVDDVKNGDLIFEMLRYD